MILDLMTFCDKTAGILSDPNVRALYKFLFSSSDNFKNVFAKKWLYMHIICMYDFIVNRLDVPNLKLIIFFC